MSNIVALKRKPKEAPTPIEEIPTNNATPDTVKNMIYDIQMWALEEGIDINRLDFKYELATIMTVLQGMVFKNENS